MSRPLSWGILGTGNIARQFCTAAATSRRTRLAAVGSRSLAAAQAFAQTYHIPGAHGSYDQLIADPAVDAVYVSLPNRLHAPWAIKALEAGKHVLCEKPLALDEGEARRMFDAAEKSGRILVEAFMYRSHPLLDAVVKAIAGGAIGQLRMIRSSFCHRMLRTEGNYRLDRTQGGGALMDVGCYCVNFSRFFAGAESTAVHAAARMHANGVDEITVGSLAFANGVVASFTCGMAAQTDNTAHLCGSEGFIEIPMVWKPPPRGAAYTVVHVPPSKADIAAGLGVMPAVPRQTFTVDGIIDLFAHEADDFAAAVLDGSAPRITRADSLATVHVLDEMRRQIGVHWP
jgi:predicted dehydrogenase